MIIGIIDYGAGNLASVQNAMNRLGVEYLTSNNPTNFNLVDKIIFPGVGHASKAMMNIKNHGFDILIQTTKKPLLGICLGMQLLGSYSYEGKTRGLGIFDFEVRKFDIDQKCPHMGWNKTKIDSKKIFTNIPQSSWFYFVHSYYVPKSSFCIAQTEYEVNFCAAIHKDNFWGVQFHPEKSGETGLQLLKNFIELC